MIWSSRRLVLDDVVVVVVVVPPRPMSRGYTSSAWYCSIQSYSQLRKPHVERECESEATFRSDASSAPLTSVEVLSCAQPTC